MKLLYYCPLSSGGIANYTHEQANALQDQGVDVSVLCSPSYGSRSDVRYRMITELVEERSPDFLGLRSWRRVLLGTKIAVNYRKLIHCIRHDGYQQALLSYSEYMSPLWIRGMNRLKSEGVVIGAVLHDPVRDHQVGPGWWHRWSVQRAYECLSHVYVHGKGEYPIPHAVQRHNIVHGNRRANGSGLSREELREKWRIPIERRVLFSFGHIRDNKNLDLVIEALRDFPKLFLVVAGDNLGGGNRPLAHYQKLAKTLGCDDRCLWINRYLSLKEGNELFEATDLAVLTYAATYHSSSAVLNMAAACQRPCLVSGGPGHLGMVVKKYQLGIWVEPDSVTAIKKGLDDWLEKGIQPDWETYFQENSWEENAKGIVQTLWGPR